MADEILPIPVIPSGLREASQVDVLIPFVGAGASRLAGCPGWGDFADGALRWLIEMSRTSTIAILARDESEESPVWWRPRQGLRARS
jgi:hypothetical protein